MSKLNTEALLTKDKNERMWFFLKGCIPTERTNAIFVMLSNISPDFVNDNGDIVVPGIPACAMLVDLVYVKSEEELIGLGMPAKYLEGMQIIKDSLEQYTTECYITEKYDEMTDEQKQLLKNINETENCLLTLRQPKDGIAAVFHFVGCGKDVNPPRLIRFREYRRGFQTPHELSFMPATLGRSGFLTTDTAQTQWLCRAASPSAGASGFALDAQSTA